MLNLIIGVHGWGEGGAGCLFVNSASALRLAGSPPDGGRRTPPLAVSKANLSKLYRRRADCLMLWSTVDVLLVTGFKAVLEVQ